MSAEISSAQPMPQRPAWQTALIVLAVLFALSEALYLGLGGLAKVCLAEGATCGQLPTAVSNALFANTVNESGASMMASAFSIGLPGFNNLFYLFIADSAIDYLGQLLATVAASIIIGFLILWGYFATTANKNAGIGLLLAIAFSIGWFVLYNNTEASVYKSGFMELASARCLEIPIGAASLFIASLVVRRRR